MTIAARLHRVLASTSGFTEHTVVLPEGTWTDVLTGHQYAGGSVLLADLLTRFPCAVLERTSDATELPADTASEDDDNRGLFGWLLRSFTRDSDG